MPTNEGFVDWVATTIPGAEYTIEGATKIAAKVTGTPIRDWVDSKPHHGYTKARRCAQGAVIMVGRPDMGAHMIVPGSALSSLSAIGRNVPEMLRIMADHDGRVARIDLAIDALDSYIDISALKRGFDNGATETLSRKISLVLSGVDGFCLYVGSRTSERFLRIYNKAAEVKSRGIPPDGTDWIRVELELKGYFANGAAQRIITDKGVARAATAYIRAFVDWPFDVRWTSALGSVKEALPRSSRKLTNTRHWLLNICAQALARQLLAEPGFQTEFERAVQSALANIQRGYDDQS